MDANDVTLEELLSSKIANPPAIEKKAEIPLIRAEMLQSAAVRLGAMAGLFKKSKEINQTTETLANRLDRIFDFNAMMVQKNVLSPVLTEGMSTFSKNSDNEIRIADRMFRIESNAKFVAYPPTWRDYLGLKESASFDMPHQSILPKDAAEKALWDEWVRKGWASGEEQASNLFSQGLARLKRDFSGMILYKSLLHNGMITPPIISGANLGTTGGGREMNIGDQVFRVSLPSNLIADPSVWKSLPRN